MSVIENTFLVWLRILCPLGEIEVPEFIIFSVAFSEGIVYGHSRVDISHE